MNALKNMVQLIGTLGNAPEFRETESGKKLARFSLATNQSYHNQNGEKVTETQFPPLIARNRWHVTALGAGTDINFAYRMGTVAIKLEGISSSDVHVLLG